MAPWITIKHLIWHIYKFFLHNQFCNCTWQSLVGLLLTKRAASRTLISVFGSASASTKPWKVDNMNWFLEKVEFSSPCLVLSLYYSVSALKCVTRHKIFLGSPRPLSTLGIGMIPIFFYINRCLEYCLQDVMISQ
jgi:hypothetical protein